jgi:hypothetical protein
MKPLRSVPVLVLTPLTLNLFSQFLTVAFALKNIVQGCQKNTLNHASVWY